MKTEKRVACSAGKVPGITLEEADSVGCQWPSQIAGLEVRMTVSLGTRQGQGKDIVDNCWRRTMIMGWKGFPSGFGFGFRIGEMLKTQKIQIRAHVLAHSGLKSPRHRAF